MILEQAPGATPLTPEDLEGLIPSYITLRSELNEAEQRNILEAESWAFARRRDVLDEAFIRRLHIRMFGNVWRWAGSYRIRETNIGSPPYRIVQDLGVVLDDVGYWVAHATYPPDMIAARFHHRLVSVHPFPNGNGRHARLSADLLLVSMGHERFTWGRVNLVEASHTRAQYIQALQAADAQDIEPLMGFVRS